MVPEFYREYLSIESRKRMVSIYFSFHLQLIIEKFQFKTSQNVYP